MNRRRIWLAGVQFTALIVGGGALGQETTTYTYEALSDQMHRAQFSPRKSIV